MFEPFLLAVVTLFIALVLIWLGRLVLAEVIISVALAVLVVVGYGPVGPLAVRSLEDTFPQLTDLPKEISGLIVLGGIGMVRHRPFLYSSGARVVEAYVVARTHPHLLILVSGGLNERRWNEAQSAKLFLANLGITPERILIEDKSTNTVQNAVFSARIAKQRKDICWALVTSAFHMPRALAAFQSAGLSPVPIPVDFRTNGSEDDVQWFARAPSENFALLGIALHEWSGMFWYWLKGNVSTPNPLSVFNNHTCIAH